MIDVSIHSIPHKEHRYPTCGDYWEGHTGARVIVVSEMANEDYELLVGFHELVEQHLCKKHGISEESITAFDVKWEKDRADGKPSKYDEPGCDPAAPYHHEHMFAMRLEKMFAREIGVDWKLYDETVMGLP